MAFKLKSSLADLVDELPGDDEPFPTACPHCKAPIESARGLMRRFGPPACAPCAARREAEIRVEQLRSHWTRICPEAFRDTNPNHPGFDLAAWAQVKGNPFGSSLLLVGPSGAGKTRMAMHRLKLELNKGRTVKAIFAEEISDHPKFASRLDRLKALCIPDTLLLDDALLAGASNRDTSAFLKDLIDRRQRHAKATIVTAQIDGYAYSADLLRFGGSLSDAERARAEAIARRIKDGFAMVPVGLKLPDPPAEGESPF